MNTPDTTQNRRPSHWLRAIEFRKHQLGREYRATLGDKAREGISDEDYATTMATLEKMAVNLGWDESQFAEGQRGFGPGFSPRFGPGGFGHRGHRGYGRPFAPESGTDPASETPAQPPKETPEA
jgi:hypothetical protein